MRTQAYDLPLLLVRKSGTEFEEILEHRERSKGYEVSMHLVLHNCAFEKSLIH
jgi:hypothetical protein